MKDSGTLGFMKDSGTSLTRWTRLLSGSSTPLRSRFPLGGQPRRWPLHYFPPALERSPPRIAGSRRRRLPLRSSVSDTPFFLRDTATTRSALRFPFFLACCRTVRASASLRMRSTNPALPNIRSSLSSPSSTLSLRSHFKPSTSCSCRPPSD